jgi:hypothetical protein
MCTFPPGGPGSRRKTHGNSAIAQTHPHDPVAKAAQEVDMRRDAFTRPIQIDNRLTRRARHILVLGLA